MPPSEATILSSFLLSKSSLQDVVTLQQFTQFFPQTKRNSPLIKHIYNNIRQRRTHTTDQIRKNIQVEAKVGTKRLLAARRKAEKSRGKDVDRDEVMVGDELYAAGQKQVDLREIVARMEVAEDLLKTELEELHEETDRILEEMKDIAGGLSDLRYGKLPGEGLEDDLVAGLKALTDLCERTMTTKR
ncbi:hypothetical protein YB2330_000260 [Saitoella coloradoensis]